MAGPCTCRKVPVPQQGWKGMRQAAERRRPVRALVLNAQQLKQSDNLPAIKSSTKALTRCPCVSLPSTAFWRVYPCTCTHTSHAVQQRQGPAAHRQHALLGLGSSRDAWLLSARCCSGQRRAAHGQHPTLAPSFSTRETSPSSPYFMRRPSRRCAFLGSCAAEAGRQACCKAVPYQELLLCQTRAGAHSLGGSAPGIRAGTRGDQGRGPKPWHSQGWSPARSLAAGSRPHRSRCRAPQSAG